MLLYPVPHTTRVVDLWSAFRRWRANRQRSRAGKALTIRYANPEQLPPSPAPDHGRATHLTGATVRSAQGVLLPTGRRAANHAGQSLHKHIPNRWGDNGSDRQQSPTRSAGRDAPARHQSPCPGFCAIGLGNFCLVWNCQASSLCLSRACCIALTTASKASIVEAWRAR